MRFARIAAENFRLFSHLEFRPEPGLNLLLGANAAGKTSVLETIHLLGRGRSFRAAAPELAGTAGPHWRVQGRTVAADDSAGQVDVAWSRDGLDLRIGQTSASLQDLVRHVAVQVLEPDSHRLLEEGPVYRRRYLDWGVFHVEHRFFPAWRRYQRALKQRNHALRTGADRGEIEAWNPELVAAGREVHAARVAHVERLRSPLASLIASLLGPLDWSVEMSPGWPPAKTLADALSEHLEQDRRQGKTVAGPHRAELRFKLGGRAAKHQVSRGQQKLLIAALLLAQAGVVEAHTGAPPVLLIDDFPAELGPPFQAALLDALRAYRGQVFLTAIECTHALATLPKSAMFHVEHQAVLQASLV